MKELLGEIESRELSEWMAFDLVEPIGGRRGDIHAGVVASTIANVNRPKERRPYTVADFVPEYGGRNQQDAGVDPDDLAMQHLAMWGVLQAVRD